MASWINFSLSCKTPKIFKNFILDGTESLAKEPKFFFKNYSIIFPLQYSIYPGITSRET